MTDSQLIEQFVGANSQAAFAEIVRRHMGLVYWTCYRQLGSPELAEDAAQAVFVILARKASSFRSNAVLASWLFQTALLTSNNVLRQEQRRQAREVRMATQMTEQPEQEEDASWVHLEPLLNDALRALSAGDRSLVIQRYFEDRSLAEIGVCMGTTPDAARMRINRALERMRRFFQHHGVRIAGVAAIAALLPTAVRPAPAACSASLLGSHGTNFDSLGSAQSRRIAQAVARARLRCQIATTAAIAAVALTVAIAVWHVRDVRAARAVSRGNQSASQAQALLDRMYATYRAMKSFRCETHSDEEPLGTEEDAVYEIERPDEARLWRHTILSNTAWSGNAMAIANGHNLIVQSTEGGGDPRRYVKMTIEPTVDQFIVPDFGSLSEWGTDPDVGMPYAAVGIGMKDQDSQQLSAPDYSVGATSLVGGVPCDTVIARRHWLQPIGTRQDVPDIVTWYIGRDDHLLHKTTASYMISAATWDTRTETYSGVEINPRIPAWDFVFHPPAGAREVGYAQLISIGRGPG